MVWLGFGPGPQFVRKHLEPHQALDAAEQGNVIDRLGEEIIGAGFQAAHPVFRLVKGGHHDDRNMLRGGIGLDALAHFDAVNARHHHVEKHDVGLGALHRFQRIHAVHGGDDFEIFGRKLGFQQTDIGEDVVDDKNAGCHFGLPRKLSMVLRKLITEIGLEI